MFILPLSNSPVLFKNQTTFWYLLLDTLPSFPILFLQYYENNDWIIGGKASKMALLYSQVLVVGPLS